jgi:hypothetical protein
MGAAPGRAGSTTAVEVVTIFLAWAATVYVLATYLHLVRSGNPHPFHWANVIGAIILAPINLATGLLPMALLNAVFGFAALVAIVKGHTT